MKIDILTIFPDFFRGPLDYGIVRRAREAGLVTIEVHDLRAFAHDRHRTVDDRPFGGGEGMVLKPEPIFECIETLKVEPRGERLAGRSRQSVILLSAQGQRFDQNVAQQLAGMENIILICGRYEGVDERVSDFLADREISIGDYVLSGGELGAAVILDTVTRLIPGAVGNEASTQQESFTMKAELKGDGPTSTCASGGLLDYPHYTRPASQFHCAQDKLRPRRGAYLPHGLQGDRQGGVAAIFQGSPRETVLPAESTRQGCPSARRRVNAVRVGWPNKSPGYFRNRAFRISDFLVSRCFLTVC